MALLEITDLAAGYGGQNVIEGCTLSVDAGQMVLLMGSNGVGKTTLLSAVAGRIPVRHGSVTLDGEALQHMPAFRRARRGLALVPQGREVVPSMSVEDNLVLAGLHGRSDTDLVYQSFPVLYERREQLAGTLSGGEAQMLALGRGLLTEPKILMLDEPSMGLAPLVVMELFEKVAGLVAELGLTVLIVEQQLTGLWKEGVVDYVYVLDDRRIAIQGRIADLDLATLQTAYLGGVPEAS